MKRWPLAAVALALLAGGAVYALRRPAATTPETRTASEDAGRARIKLFWKHFEQASTARIHGDCPAAAAAYKEALAVDPNHEDSLYYLGNCLVQTGDYAGALAALTHLTEVNPRSSRGHLQSGILLSAGLPGAVFDLERARRSFEAAQKLNSEETGAALRLGEVDLALGDLEGSRRWLEAVRSTNPRAVAAPFFLGYLAWSANDAEGARTRLAEAAERLKTAKPVLAATSEGDTKAAGSKALLVEGVEGRSLLGPFWTSWAARHGDKPVTRDDLADAYDGLDRYLKALRAQGPAAAAALRPVLNKS